MSSRSNEVTVLAVEDNEIDVEAIQRAFVQERIANPLIFAKDGVEALELLRGGKVPHPYIILLDLNLPRMSGIEFLQEIRSDPKLNKSVVFVVTTSNAEFDRTSCYDLNVAGYVVKRDVGGDFMRLTRMLDRYWTVVTLPENMED